MLGAESAAIVLLDGGGAEPAGLVTDDGDAAAGALVAALRGDTTSAVAEAVGGPVRLPQPAGDARGERAAPPLLADLRSYLAAPIRFEDHLLGTLHVADKGCGGEFTDLDVQVASVLAAQAAISLENARIHQRTLGLVADLDQANVALQQASETRSRFLASVSHELRTPLHAILVAAQLVRDSASERGADRRVRGLGATIEGSGRHLLGLVDDFVDLSRIEVGAFDIRPAELALSRLLHEVRRDLAPLAGEKGVDLAIADGRGIRLTADPLRLRQVLLNLLSNALKFTPRGGLVRTTVQVDDGELRISVHDTGIGIAPDNLERAFQPFEQVSGTDLPGAGLGLTISRWIVELHGGTLTAESTLGKGSTFTVTLPIVDQVLGAGAPTASTSASTA